jgi:Na+-transporting NADH:ubiquinone oxidoreductase subunit B
MNFVRKRLDKIKPLFEKGGKLEKFYYAWEPLETFLFVPNETTEKRGVQIRDAMDMKRLMTTVIIAMLPCLLFGIWNVGHQHFLAAGESIDFWTKVFVGAKLVLPIVVVAYAVGLGTEFAIAVIRKHPVNEGFLVTGMLIPLVMPPDIPLWQVALATVFAVVVGKEAFGGTGMNILNVALTARAFLYFAYPSQISGDVWVHKGGKEMVDGYTGATPLSIGAEVVESGKEMTAELASYGKGWADGIFEFGNMFFGMMPGSIGETSTLMALIGILILIATGVGSWKIIVGVFGGAFFMGTVMNLIGANSYMLMPAHYHLVIGGLAFGAAFMATDPVTATQTERGKWYYGILIGVLTVVIRVWNPAYPEGIMLAILLMNVFAPLIDYFVVGANKKRRLRRAAV